MLSIENACLVANGVAKAGRETLPSEQDVIIIIIIYH